MGSEGPRPNPQRAKGLAAVSCGIDMRASPHTRVGEWRKSDWECEMPGRKKLFKNGTKRKVLMVHVREIHLNEKAKSF